jgi:hypothetical protein
MFRINTGVHGDIADVSCKGIIVNVSISEPLTTRPSVAIPSSPAITAAVFGWSPVIMIGVSPRRGL